MTVWFPPRPIYMPSIFHESAISLTFQVKAARVPVGPRERRDQEQRETQTTGPKERVTQTTGPRYRKDPDNGTQTQ